MTTFTNACTFLAILFALSGSAAVADDLLVPDDFSTIQSAVGAAEEGDTVLVEPGIYQETVTIDKAITVRSTVSREVTTIDGSEMFESVVTILGDGAVFEGFTITNCLVEGDGAGMFVEGSPIIRECDFVDNSAVEFNSIGGGMFIAGSPTIEDCTFIGNLAEYSGGGAGAVTTTGNPTFSECLFIENTAFGGNFAFGGGAAIFDAAASFHDCTFTDNVIDTGSGGGVGYLGTDVTFTQCVFTDNYAGAATTQGGGGLGGGVACIATDRFPSGRFAISECEFDGNLALFQGGGIHLQGSDTDIEVNVVNCGFIENTVLTQNVGGGLAGVNFSAGSVLSIVGSTFHENSAPGGGGAWLSTGETTTNLIDCEFSSNDAASAGGLAVIGNAQIIRSDFIGNSAGSAGALEILQAEQGTITNCTVRSNTAVGDVAGMEINGNVTVANCEITNNVSDNFAGGMRLSSHDQSTPTVTNCTIANNIAEHAGGGVIAASAMKVSMTNSIIWNNIATDGDQDNIAFSSPAKSPIQSSRAALKAKGTLILIHNLFQTTASTIVCHPIHPQLTAARTRWCHRIPSILITTAT